MSECDPESVTSIVGRSEVCCPRSPSRIIVDSRNVPGTTNPIVPVDVQFTSGGRQHGHVHAPRVVRQWGVHSILRMCTSSGWSSISSANGSAMS
jgi:hypothetical protein